LIESALGYEEPVAGQQRLHSRRDDSLDRPFVVVAIDELAWAEVAISARQTAIKAVRITRGSLPEGCAAVNFWNSSVKMSE
jgi:hypothetical protein